MKTQLSFTMLLIIILMLLIPLGAEAANKDMIPEPPRPRSFELPDGYRLPAQPPYESNIIWMFQEIIMYRCDECN